MINNPKLLISDFIQVAILAGFSINRDDIIHEVLSAPHKPENLPKGTQAVYVFSLSSSLILKVGKVGPKSNARFVSQHYNPNSSGSNLAKSILKSPQYWNKLGITQLNQNNVGSWIQHNTERENFYISANQDKLLLSLMEVFFQSRLHPLFEG